jgi:hypothetical protein
MTIAKHKASPHGYAGQRIANGLTVNYGDIVSLRLAAFGTAGQRGFIGRYTAAAGERVLGFYLGGGSLGTRDSVVGNGVEPAGVDLEPGVLKDTAVTGLVDDATHVGVTVYATDHNTLTITAPSTGVRAWIVGEVLKVNAAGVGDVFWYGFADSEEVIGA